MESGSRVEDIRAVHAVSGVRDIPEVVLAAQFVPVELRRIGQKELVAGGVEDELGNGHAMPGLVRIRDSQQLLDLLLAETRQDAVQCEVGN